MTFSVGCGTHAVCYFRGSHDQWTEHVTCGKCTDEPIRVTPRITRNRQLQASAKGSFIAPALIDMNARAAASGYPPASHGCRSGAQTRLHQMSRSTAAAQDPRLACAHEGCASQSWSLIHQQIRSAGEAVPAHAVHCCKPWGRQSDGTARGATIQLRARTCPSAAQDTTVVLPNPICLA